MHWRRRVAHGAGQPPRIAVELVVAGDRAIGRTSIELSGPLGICVRESDHKGRPCHHQREPR